MPKPFLLSLQCCQSFVAEPLYIKGESVLLLLSKWKQKGEIRKDNRGLWVVSGYYTHILGCHNETLTLYNALIREVGGCPGNCVVFQMGLVNITKVS